ncbi:MAG TPA: RNA polymerase sigma factor [Candidatus Omnitrophota bacterium]|nr:RNA polymerase sigma factor [Candidatus Omnitrophota bacterium]HPS36975.1 RNA polymerase sigma factor [Candidatus Omnitrophota bacterium]
MQEIEKELIVRAGAGDMVAFREVYQKASGFVYALAYRITGRKHDAEEVTQDVFLKLHKELCSFKFESSFKTWLYRVAVNTALNAVKKRNRVSGREVEYDEPVPAGITVTATVTRNIEEEDMQRQLKVLLDQLNPDQRACLVLREIDGLDYQAIAQSLGININTVRSRLKRAREALMLLGQAQGSIEKGRLERVGSSR